MHDWLEAAVRPRTAGTYDTYRAAQEAASDLSVHGIPIGDVAVMAEGVRAVQDDGQSSRSDAARHGIVAGVAAAASLVVLGAVDPGGSAGAPVVVGIVATSLLGAVAGLAAALVLHVVRGRMVHDRGAWSLYARRWSVLVDEGYSEHAAAVLARRYRGRAGDRQPRIPSPSTRQPLTRGAAR